MLTIKSQDSLSRGISDRQIFEVGQHLRSGTVEPKWFSDRWPYKTLYRLGFGSKSLERYSSGWIFCAKKMRKRLRAIRLDCIVATYRPPSSLFISKQLSSYLRAPWVADFRDLGAYRLDDRNLFTRLVDQRVEQYLVGSAAAFTTVSHTWQKIIQQSFKRPCYIIENGFDQASEPPVNLLESGEAALPQGYLHYAGQLYHQQMAPA